jgi:YHS domain-containing protein
MHKTMIAVLAILVGLTWAGTAAPEQHSGMDMENCLCHMTGVTYKAQTLKDGVTLTITSQDPATVKTIQERAQKLSATKDVKADPDEIVTCLVQGTKIKRSQAFDSTVYKGKTYYFCCAGCKPAFLKDPEKYLSQAAAPAPR